jgi:Flp pilus assembly protein TadG
MKRPAWWRSRRLLRSSRRPGAWVDERGSAAIEFAILSPIVFFFVLGTVELALDMIVDASVQIAAENASRTGLTTTAPATGTRASQAQAIVMATLGRWQNIGATVSITALDYGNYNNVGTPNYQTGLGGLGDVVSYQIAVSLPQGFTGLPKYFGVPMPMVFQRIYLVQNEK